MASVREILVAAPAPVRTFGVSWPLVVGVLAVLGLLTGIKSTGMLSDPDTYWHLAAGRWIVENGSVPKGDPFSHSMPGSEWTAHEWLSEIVMFGVHRAAGWSGLVAMFALLFAATLAIGNRFLLMRRLEPVHALLLTAFTAFMLGPHLLARPHVFGWPMLVLWAGTLLGAAEARRAPPWWLLGLMMLWANLHGSFTLGVALGVALALDAVLTLPREERLAAAKPWGAFVLLSIGAAMVTPAGWKGLWYTVHVMSLSYGLNVIQEWQSPDFHRVQPLEFWLMLALAAAFTGRVRLPWLRVVLVLGLLHLALRYQRNVPMLGLLSPLLIALPLATHAATMPKTGQDAEALDRVFRAMARPARAGALAVAGVLMLLVVAATSGSARFVPPAESTPMAAVDAALKAKPPGPVFNAYNFGGYLIYRGIPVFMDGRSEMYGDALLKRYVEAVMLKDGPDLTAMLSEYRIGWTLLETGTPAIAVLDRLPEWRRVHADTIAVVHVRVAPMGAATR